MVSALGVQLLPGVGGEHHKAAMSVTITYFGNKTHVFSVPAGKSETYVVNDATYGSHKISFKTVNNVLSGTVRVRVSDMELS